MEPYIIGPPLKPPLAGSWSLLSVDFHEIENYVFFCLQFLNWIWHSSHLFELLSGEKSSLKK